MLALPVTASKHVSLLAFAATLNELRKIRNRFGGAPSEADLLEAAKSLNRLQEIYRLDVSEFADGKIMGQQTGAELSVKDTFYLGRYGTGGAQCPTSANIDFRLFADSLL